MTRNRVLIDTNFLFALYNTREPTHEAARRFTDTTVATWLLPDVALVELHFLVNRFGGATEVVKFLQFLAARTYELECLTQVDLQRVETIVSDYPKANFDFVDCCLMALAERLNITQICTFDRRDFSIFRPRHADYLELLP
jgi:predicted nucleic acid-binding protein